VNFDLSMMLTRSKIGPARYISASIPRIKISSYRRTYASSIAASTPVAPLPTKITTLPNKLRVATEATPGHFSAVGVYIDAGSRYEAPRYTGVSHILDRMAFKVGFLALLSSLHTYQDHIHRLIWPCFSLFAVADKVSAEHAWAVCKIHVHGN
jgi:hypothetical protein